MMWKIQQAMQDDAIRTARIHPAVHPGNRDEVLIWQNFQPAYRDLGWKNQETTKANNTVNKLLDREVEKNCKMFANPVFITPGRIMFVQTTFVAIFFNILVQGFCPLKINSTQFPDGFRINKRERSFSLGINTYSVHKAEKIIRKDIEKKEVQGLIPEQPPF